MDLEYPDRPSRSLAGNPCKETSFLFLPRTNSLYTDIRPTETEKPLGKRFPLIGLVLLYALYVNLSITHIYPILVNYRLTETNHKEVL